MMLLHVSLTFSLEDDAGDLKVAEESNSEKNDTLPLASKMVLEIEDITPVIQASRFNCLEMMYEGFLTAWVCRQLYL